MSEGKDQFDKTGVIEAMKNRRDDFDEATENLPDKPPGSNLDAVIVKHPPVPI